MASDLAYLPWEGLTSVQKSLSLKLRGSTSSSLGKLVTPFRTPSAIVPKVLSSKKENIDVKTVSTSFRKPSQISSKPIPNFPVSSKAASQFKSPTAASSVVSRSGLSPSIPALEQKLQTLNRAVKILRSDDSEELERLTAKWVQAGRDVAWDVWALVKDNVTGSNSVTGTRKRGYEENWGWEERVSKTQRGGDERHLAWATEPEKFYREDNIGQLESDLEERGEESLGTMLRQLGIAPETLGWSEEEGDFVNQT